MLKVTITQGLPASGKTTWAKEQVSKSSGLTAIVCRDDIRNMLWNGMHSKSLEKMVKSTRNHLICSLLESGRNVIVADTNFGNNINDITALVEDWSAKNDKRVEVCVKSFTDVPLSVCIERDKKRANPVGESVIRRFYNDFLRKDIEPMKQDTNLPKAIICDIDGTLAHMDRGPFEWHRVGEDRVDENVKDLISRYNTTHKILIVSGRDSVCRDLTAEWLDKHQIVYNGLYMRPEGDNRKDSIIKEEIFNNFIKDKFYVDFVLDDRNSVVDFWRSIGLKCFQVAEGDF